MKISAYGLLLVAIVLLSGTVSTDAEERRTTTTTTTTDPTTESTSSTLPPSDSSTMPDPTDPTGGASVPSSGDTMENPNAALYPLLYFPETKFVVAPGGTAKVNYVAQCSADSADLDCSVQIYSITAECTLHDSYTLQTAPTGMFKYLPAGHYVFLIGKGLNWAEASKLPTTKSYLVTVTE